MCVCVLVAQLCPTLCDPTDWGPPDSSVHGVFQARRLKWVAIPFSRGISMQWWRESSMQWRGSSMQRSTHFFWLKLCCLLSCFSRVRLCATPWIAAFQASRSMGFSRQEHWSGLPFSSPMHASEKWVKLLSRVWLLATPWTAAYQAPLSMGFSRQQYWSGMPLPVLFITVQIHEVLMK